MGSPAWYGSYKRTNDDRGTLYLSCLYLAKHLERTSLFLYGNATCMGHTIPALMLNTRVVPDEKQLERTPVCCLSSSYGWAKESYHNHSPVYGAYECWLNPSRLCVESCTCSRTSTGVTLSDRIARCFSCHSCTALGTTAQL